MGHYDDSYEADEKREKMLTSKTEILKKLGLTLEGIFAQAPKWAKWLSITANGRYLYSLKSPEMLNTCYIFDDEYVSGYHLTNGEPFDMTGIDWTACVFQKPVDESEWVGLLGKAWNPSDTGFFLDILQRIEEGNSCKYTCRKYGGYQNFKPLTIAELDEYKRRAVEAGIE